MHRHMKKGGACWKELEMFLWHRNREDAEGRETKSGPWECRHLVCAFGSTPTPPPTHTHTEPQGLGFRNACSAPSHHCLSSSVFSAGTHPSGQSHFRSPQPEMTSLSLQAISLDQSFISSYLSHVLP